MAEDSRSAHCDASRFPLAFPFGCEHWLYPHAVQFFLNDEFLVNLLGNFVGSAIKTGDGIVILATQDHRHELARQLKVRDIDVNAFRSKDGYVELDTANVLSQIMVNGLPDSGRFNRVIGRSIATARDASVAKKPCVMAFGEAVGVLVGNGELEAALELERLWNELAGSLPFSLLCGCPIREFERAGGEDSFLRICAQHSTVSPPDSFPSPELERRILRATARS